MRPAARRALWIVGAVALLIFTCAILSTWNGTCVDYVNAPGVCTYEPAVGGPQSVVLSIMAVTGAVVCTVRAVRVKSRGTTGNPRR